MKTKIFIQDWGTFPNKTLICVGGTYEYMFKYLIFHKINADFLAEYKERINSEIERKSNGIAIVAKTGESILWLKRYNCKKWSDIECLLHELHHLIFFISFQKNFEEEPEAQAYQLEYLFKNIRRKISK